MPKTPHENDVLLGGVQRKVNTGNFGGLSLLMRRNPTSGYMSESVFKAFGFTQIVRDGRTVYISGIAPLRGGLEDLEIIGAGDLRAQIKFCFEVMRQQLAGEELGLEHVVAQTMYVTDMEAFRSCGDIMAGLFGDASPSATVLGVTALFHPEQQFEVSAIAVAP
jgi:2-iminobutanoate/2-iminopropanoate deaminase